MNKNSNTDNYNKLKISSVKYDYTLTTYNIIDTVPEYLYYYENELAKYCKIKFNTEQNIDDKLANKNKFDKLINTNKTVAKYYLDLDNNNNYYQDYGISKTNNKKFSGCYETNIKLFILYFIQKNIKYFKKLQKNTKYFNNDSISLIEIYN